MNSTSSSSVQAYGQMDQVSGGLPSTREPPPALPYPRPHPGC